MITLWYLKKALKYLWNYFSKNISSSVESDSLFISEKNEAITIVFNLIKLNQASRDSSMTVSDLAFSSVKSPTGSVKGSGAGLGDDICPLVSWTQSRDWASISDNTSETGLSLTVLLSIYVWQEKTTLLLKTFHLISLTVCLLHLRLFFFFFNLVHFQYYADGISFSLSLNGCPKILYTRHG